uniref:Uncharacterized protein n=1 Tax=Panagrolaimus sp. PS1159 TaxID=55785 RepID=A0AC35F395_9BILA
MATFDMKTTMNPRNSIVEMEDHRDSIGGDQKKFLQDRPSHLLGFSQKYSPLLLVLLGTVIIVICFIIALKNFKETP